MIALFSHRRQLTDEETGTLFRSTYPRLYRLAYSLLNDPEESRDIVNGAFTDLLEKRMLTTDVNEGYLRAMVHNRSLDFLRHRRVEDEARTELMREYQVYMSPDNAHEERVLRIRHLIQTELTPQTRRVLQLCYEEKMTYHEAATELGISIQAVNKHISQALRKLRERLNPSSVQPKTKSNI